MKKPALIAVAMLAGLLTAGISVQVFSHCQIPCGIYDDEARFNEMHEHITTIEKSMNLIQELSAEPQKNYNQIVRWVNNKDDHAEKLTHIVTYYFMAQRVAPADESDADAYEAYTNDVVLLHKMVYEAMKCKQTVDLQHVENLHDLVEEYREAYFSEE